MKKILFSILFLCGFILSSYSQATYTIIKGHYEYQWLKIDSLAAIPRYHTSGRPAATTVGQIILNLDSNKLQFSDGSNWNTISASTSGSGGTLMNVGSGYRWAIFGTSNVKTLLPGYSILVDSLTANSLTITVDTSKVVPYTDTLKGNGMASKTYVTTRGFLTAENDPVATAKTVTETQSTGILITGTATQSVGANPSWIFKVDTILIATQYDVGLKLNKTDTTAMLTPYLRKVDTPAMLAPYLRKIDTASLSNRINLKLNISDTTLMLFAYLRKSDTAAMLSKYLRKTDTATLSARINLKVSYSDTLAMLLPYLRKVDTTAMLSVYLRKIDTASLSNRINLKVNISDTAAMLSTYLRSNVAAATYATISNLNLKLDSVTRAPGNDSVFFWHSGIKTFAFFDSTGGGGTGNILSINSLTNPNITFVTGTVGTDFNINTTGSNTINLNMPTTSASNRGLVTSTLFNTWNAKQNALNFGNLSENISSVLTFAGNTGAVIGTGTTIQVKQASTTQSGYLSAADYTRFNSNSGGTVTNVTGVVPIHVATGATTPNITIDNAKADNLTKGAATFNSTNFSDNGAGLISAVYPNFFLKNGLHAHDSVTGYLGGGLDTSLTTLNGHDNDTLRLDSMKSVVINGVVSFNDIGGTAQTFQMGTGHTTAISFNGNTGASAGIPFQGFFAADGGVANNFINASNASGAIANFGLTTANNQNSRFYNRLGNAESIFRTYFTGAKLVTNRKWVVSTQQNLGAETNLILIDSVGSVNLPHYTTSTNQYLTTDASGNLTEGNTIVSGSFTPSLTNTTNISSSSLSQAVYSQNGNIVTATVSGAFTPTSGASTATTLTIGLPVNTATTTQTGVGSGSIAINAGGLGYASTFASVNAASTFQIFWVATSTTSCNFSVTIQYHIN